MKKMQSTWTNDLDAKTFYLEMIANLTSSLERVIGCEDAEGYLALVGAEMGCDLYNAYLSELKVSERTLEKIADVLVDLKAHIEGGFAIESVKDGQIILTNTHCPFGEKALGRQSLCMMTSSVFGTISSEAAGQANVDIQKSIAAGDGYCRVVVHLNKPDAPGKRYFGRTS
jgi:predicted ArsR family transcriptional regulator